ncbi:hypothetical protein AAG906_027186 [Vitis piasezkii]
MTLNGHAENSAQYQRTVEKDCVNCDKNGLIHFFIHISISHSIWVCANPFSFVWIQEEARLSLADSKCIREDEGEKLKVKVLVKWSKKDWLA